MLLTEQCCQSARVYPGHRSKGTDPVYDQCAEEKEYTLAQYGELPGQYSTGLGKIGGHELP